MQYQGRVQQFSVLKGFGFLIEGFKNRVFFHVRNWKSDIAPKIGMPVQFNLGPANKPELPDQAVNIIPLSEAPQKASDQAVL